MRECQPANLCKGGHQESHKAKIQETASCPRLNNIEALRQDLEREKEGRVNNKSANIRGRQGSEEIELKHRN